MRLPEIVTREDWLVARKAHLAKEKQLTRAMDEPHADRRRLPIVRIEENHTFERPGGEFGLPDLFDGRRQLVVYHFMFQPEWDLGWISFCRPDRPPGPPVLPGEYDYRSRAVWATTDTHAGPGERAVRPARAELLPAGGRRRLPHVLDLPPGHRHDRLHHQPAGPDGVGPAGGAGGAEGQGDRPGCRGWQPPVALPRRVRHLTRPVAWLRHHGQAGCLRCACSPETPLPNRITLSFTLLSRIVARSSR